MARCALCNDQEKKREYQPRLAFNFTLEELLQSAWDCNSCLVILEGLRQARSLDGCSLLQDVRSVYARCHNQRKDHRDSLSLEVYFFDERPRLELEFYSLQPQAWKAILPRPPTSGHPLSEQALKWARSHLEDCKRTHVLCADAEENRRPKRILSLREDPDGKISVRLVNPGIDPNVPEYGAYAALSHVWGKERICTTTTETHEDHRRGIPWDAIPATFKHAITIVLKLNIELLWIDSLCIVQDDMDDWEIESSKMADTYQNATLTLAATASSSDSHGCFPESQGLDSDVEIKLPYNVPECRIAVREPLRHWDTANPRQIKDPFPLLSRGWVFQERLLSPRILHLCEQELVWECRRLCICECGGLEGGQSRNGIQYEAIKGSQNQRDEATSAWLRRPNRTRKLFSDMTVWPSAKSSIPPGIPRLSLTEIVRREAEWKDFPELFLQFHRIVEQYSALELTKPTDRLPALSGLCERMQHDRGDYIAGLWSDSICADLMWRKDILYFENNQAARLAEYRGPSWSWIAVDGPVSYWFDLTSFRESPRERDGRVRSSESNARRVEANAVQAGASRPWTQTANRQQPPVAPFPSQKGKAKADLVSPTPLGQKRDQIMYDIKIPGRNPFGAVEFASITVQASATTATLCYTHTSSRTGDQQDELDPAHYHLKIAIPEVEGSAGYDIAFFADYPLGLNGPHKVINGSKVTILLVHPRVCLVLLPKLNDVWRRIGIVRIPEELITYYEVDWMRESEVRQFTIV